eukprot:TRINITY_DN94591_c0_g1_i1.p1 TRINITY_DN94591_c0_g1~~TRINITY_DN94591_c0_g1_i1.p1  ORF type:complete len:375 (+),score=64.40 TRINITY_DN94591_c0_g1_i1:324-1448(+)
MVDADSIRQAAFGKTGRDVTAANAAERGDDGRAADALSFRVYEIRGRAGIVDACIVPACRPHEDAFSLTHESSGGLGVIALGTQPFLSLHAAKSSVGIGGERSLIGAAASKLGSYARSWVPFGRPANSDASRSGFMRSAGLLAAADMQVPLTSGAEELPVAAKFLDHTRQGEVLEPAPSRKGHGSYLGVSCDGFGRVCLFCLETVRCLHVWKGYRDAQVAWLQSSKCTAVSSNGNSGKWQWISDDEDEESCPQGPSLVIYAPRRGLLEIWRLGAEDSPKGPVRAAADVVGEGCRLLASPDGKAHLLRPCGRLERVVCPSEPSLTASPTGLTANTTEAEDSDSFDSVGSEDEQNGGAASNPGAKSKTSLESKAII